MSASIAIPSLQELALLAARDDTCSSTSSHGSVDPNWRASLRRFRRLVPVALADPRIQKHIGALGFDACEAYHLLFDSLVSRRSNVCPA